MLREGEPIPGGIKEKEELAEVPAERKIEKERQPTIRILLVEDRPEYQKAAIKGLEKAGLKGKVVVETAKDYDEAMKLIEKGEKNPKEKFDCIVTDLLFPERTGSGDHTLGIGVTERIRETIESSNLRDVEDRGVRENVMSDLGELEKAVGGEKYGIHAPIMRWEAEREGRGTEKRSIFKSAEAVQPLGVLIVEKAKEMGLPYVIVTSGHGAHNDVTTPISFYLKVRGLIPNFRGAAFRGVSMESRESEKMFTEEEFIRHEQEYYKRMGWEIPSKEEAVRKYREQYEGNPFFTDIDKRVVELWSYILSRAAFYVEQKRKTE
ncbi:hypothetical protein KAW65_00345 [candidate division WOR-3 bacterium]|nr:hypothetical protein [candidate division WOR-3 bacterium]